MADVVPVHGVRVFVPDRIVAHGRPPSLVLCPARPGGRVGCFAGGCVPVRGVWAGVSCGVFDRLTRLDVPAARWTMIFVNSRTDFGVMPVKMMKLHLGRGFRLAVFRTVRFSPMRFVRRFPASCVFRHRSSAGAQVRAAALAFDPHRMRGNGSSFVPEFESMVLRFRDTVPIGGDAAERIVELLHHDEPVDIGTIRSPVFPACAPKRLVVPALPSSSRARTMALSSNPSAGRPSARIPFARPLMVDGRGAPWATAAVQVELVPVYVPSGPFAAVSRGWSFCIRCQARKASLASRNSRSAPLDFLPSAEAGGFLSRMRHVLTFIGGSSRTRGRVGVSIEPSRETRVSRGVLPALGISPSGCVLYRAGEGCS